MFTTERIIPRLFQRFGPFLAAAALLFAISSAALAATYYVSPTGSNSLSTSSSSPGSLSYAIANAPTGSTVILENGTYDGSPNGYTINISNVTFQAQSWHGAIIENSTGSNLWGPSDPSTVTGVICQGMVFGPSTGLGWSGGGGANWQFLDCEFTQNGGVGAGNSCVFERCLFTDAYSNSFDLAGTNQSLIDCIARRGNRVSADDDAVGNKEDGAQNLLFNDFIAYDNNGAALWFDTDNDSWTIENSTFFGNHGGNNWYYCGVGSGSSTTQFTGYGQDGQSIAVGQPILGLTGADAGAQSVVTAVTGYNPQTITVSPALPVTPDSNDQFAVQQDGASVGDGFITEANDNGTFTNNWVYSNTDAGFFDHSSGGSTYGGTGGLVVENNLFAYDSEGFFVWSDARDQGPATVEYNQFKFLPGTSGAFDSWGSTPGAYPYLGQITFDYNDYNPDNDNGGWAVWYTTSPPPTAGGLTAGSQPAGQDYLQNPATWNQDYHSNTNSVTFYGTPPAVYVWPAGTDTNWSDVYFPNNTFGLSNSIHQIDDTDGAINNTIDAAVAGKAANSVVTIPVSAHTPITGSGPYSCEVYDLNGRWVTLSIPTANLSGFESAVPPYVTCGANNATKTYNIQVTLNSTPPYNVTATYNPEGNSPAAPTDLTASPGNHQISLSWTSGAGATSYNIYRGTTTNAEAATPIGTSATTSFTDTSLTNGQMYYYKVAAVSSSGTSAMSNEASATPQAPVLHTFPAGLQMIAAPTDDIGYSFTQIFSQANTTLAVWSAGQYVLSPTAPADTIVPGRGYWVRFANSTSMYDVGNDTSSSQSLSVPLSAGWNMIGDPFASALSASSIEITSGSKSYSLAQANQAGLIGGTIYTYQAGNTSYQSQPASAATLAPYEGYWIDAFSPCTLVFSAGT